MMDIEKLKKIVMTDEEILAKQQELPKVGEIYPCYDDGKVREDRRQMVKINSIVEFDKRDLYLDDLWIMKIADWEVHGRPFDRKKPTTDYFIEGTLVTDEEYDSDVHDVVFIRSEQNEWFCLLGNGGLLDVTQGYMQKYEDTWLMSEAGRKRKWDTEGWAY
jgi:hypothetical protein